LGNTLADGRIYDQKKSRDYRVVIDLRPKGTLFSGAAVVSQPPDRCSTLQAIIQHSTTTAAYNTGGNHSFTKTEQCFLAKAVEGRDFRGGANGKLLQPN